MDEPVIENGAAKVSAGEWLVPPDQPVAAFGTVTLRGQKGLFVRDRALVRVATIPGAAWCASAERPFLTVLSALPDVSLNLVSAKLLVASVPARVGAKALKLVPMSLRKPTVITEFRKGLVVAATRSRVTRVTVGADETLSVRPEALVAWIGARPTGSCPKLTVLDLVLPRGPKNLAYSFHGPATVWFEGAALPRVMKGIRPYGVSA